MIWSSSKNAKTILLIDGPYHGQKKLIDHDLDLLAFIQGGKQYDYTPRGDNKYKLARVS